MIRPAASAPILRFNSATLAETRRIRIETDSLNIDAPSSFGGYQPETQVFWDEIGAVYVWTAPNWSTIAVGLVLSPIFGLVAGLAVSGSGTGAATAAGVVVFVLVLALCLYLGIYVRPARWFQLDTAAGWVKFNSRHPALPDAILSRLVVLPEPQAGSPVPQQGGL